MASLGFPPNWVYRPILVLIGFVVFFFALATITLIILKVDITIARARVFDTDLSAGKEKVTARSLSDVRAVNVSLHDFAVSLDKRTALGARLPPKTIVNPISTTFQAGVINGKLPLPIYRFLGTPYKWQPYV